MESKNTNGAITKSKYIPASEFYSQVIDSLQDYSIFTIDNDLKINSWNAGASQIFGYAIDEVIGKDFDLIFTNEDKELGIPTKEIKNALNEGRATDNRWHLRKDNTKFYANGLVFPLVGKEDEHLGYVKILRDLTQQKKSEDAIQNYIRELEDLNTHKESVMAILSHDLRGPLAGMIGITSLLQSKMDSIEPPKVKELLEHLHKAALDELNMLDYLVEWARIKYASEVFSPTKLELALYVQKVFDSLKETANLNTINLHNEIEKNEKVFADKKMLLSVIQNIVSNAIKHSKPGGKIIVTAKREKLRMIISIKDTGVGMSKEIQDKLFKPEIGALSKQRKENKGAGIGLLLVKGFLEKNGGEIWVESTEGVGSSFYFTLPIEEPVNGVYKEGKNDKDIRSESLV